MENKFIIITGKQGSGKTTRAKQIQEQLSRRKPYSRQKIKPDIFHYPDNFSYGKINEQMSLNRYVIVEIQKENLNKVFRFWSEYNYEIIDMDCKQSHFNNVQQHGVVQSKTKINKDALGMALQMLLFFVILILAIILLCS